MAKNLSAWDWNSNDADVCCTGGSTPSFIVWGASTQARGFFSCLFTSSPVTALSIASLTLFTFFVLFIHRVGGVDTGALPFLSSLSSLPFLSSLLLIAFVVFALFALFTAFNIFALFTAFALFSLFALFRRS